MTDEQRALARLALERHAAWAKSVEKEVLRAWFVSTGIYDKEGNLTPQYGGK